jgi:hypothetical protein
LCRLAIAGHLSNELEGGGADVLIVVLDGAEGLDAAAHDSIVRHGSKADRSAPM